MKNYKYIFKIKNEILNIGSDEYKDIFKEDFLNKFKKEIKYEKKSSIKK
jgi:hypothetical protein